MSAITEAEMIAIGAGPSDIFLDYAPRAFLFVGSGHTTPLDWSSYHGGHPHITNNWQELGDCIGAIIAYMYNVKKAKS